VAAVEVIVVRSERWSQEVRIFGSPRGIRQDRHLGFEADRLSKSAMPRHFSWVE